MPTYTFSCGCGWRGDQRAGFAVSTVPCPTCRAPAARESVYRISTTGFAVAPMRQRRIPLNRVVEAQGQMLRDAERAGVEPPDCLALAQRQAAHIQRYAPELVTGT